MFRVLGKLSLLAMGMFLVAILAVQTARSTPSEGAAWFILGLMIFAAQTSASVWAGTKLGYWTMAEAWAVQLSIALTTCVGVVALHVVWWVIAIELLTAVGLGALASTVIFTLTLAWPPNRVSDRLLPDDEI